MRFCEGYPTSFYEGKLCIVDSDKVTDPNLYFMKDLVCKIIDIRDVQGYDMAIIEPVDLYQVPYNIRQAIAGGQEMGGLPEDMEIARFRKGQYLKNVNVKVDSIVEVTHISWDRKLGRFEYEITSRGDSPKSVSYVTEFFLKDYILLDDKSASTITGKPVSNDCKHTNKYKNIISNNLKFWCCRDCGKDLGDIKG